MPDMPEWGHEDEPVQFTESTEHLKIRFPHGAEWEVKAAAIGPTNAPMACTICMLVPTEMYVDAGPADIICDQCAQAIRRALDVYDGTRAKVATMLTSEQAAAIAGIPEEDVRELASTAAAE